MCCPIWGDNRCRFGRIEVEKKMLFKVPVARQGARHDSSSSSEDKPSLLIPVGPTGVTQRDRQRVSV